MVIDLLGRARSTEGDWLTAEKTLVEIGRGFLVDPFEFRLASGRWLPGLATTVSTSTSPSAGSLELAPENQLILPGPAHMPEPAQHG